MVAVVDAQPQFAVEIGPASPAGDRSCLDHRDGVTRFAQRHSGGQSGQAGADDMDVHLPRGRHCAGGVASSRASRATAASLPDAAAFSNHLRASARSRGTPRPSAYRMPRLSAPRRVALLGRLPAASAAPARSPASRPGRADTSCPARSAPTAFPFSAAWRSRRAAWASSCGTPLPCSYIRPSCISAGAKSCSAAR